MHRALLIAAIFVVTSSALPPIRAQNQQGPAGVAPSSQPPPAGSADQGQPVGVIGPDSSMPASTDATANYPMDQAGVMIKDDKIRDARRTAVANQYPTKTRAAHSIAASLSYGIVPVKIVAEYEGEHAFTQVETAQPVLCLCHFMSLPGEPVLVRLHPKKGARELDGGKMIVYPVVGGSKMADANKTDLIPADVSRPDPRVWLVRPQSPLEPGEYALMLGTQNMSIFPFTVAPPPAPSSGTK
jgi:hypothetical protein